ncbi:hypothetical protein KI688_007693 [Linnemannia hyalina]|uniref:GATA-type domain-containing protein n=1 Tax=Linnemannia hyalina TaxID=64524 RepID=A0A9P7XJF6_9FUNG|nr:hypothetical protein KI688_007693 [Linnemannia hyalina]
MHNARQDCEQEPALDDLVREPPPSIDGAEEEILAKEMTADVQPTESEATPCLDAQTESTSAATVTSIPTVPTPTTSTATAATPIVVKRGRGRPRKSESGTGAPNTLCTQDEITGHPSALLAATGTSSSSPLGSSLSQQRPTAHLNSTNSINSINNQCESCMSFDTRLYKFGKLKVCKMCENLMRTMTGSSRRQTVVPPTPPTASSSSSSASTALTKQGHNVSTAPSQKPQVDPKAASKSSKQDQIGVNTISHFATVPHSTFDPSITTISPSSLVLVPEPKPVRVILTKRGEIAKKRGRKPKARDESTNLAAKVVPVPASQSPQQPTADPASEQVAVKKRNRNPMALYPYNILPVTDPASVVVFKSKSATYVEASVTATPAASITFPPPTDPSGSSVSHGDNFHFQTTGAFLTRTASKLLGGQEVIGVDSNIHGYAHGRLVKVQNIDKTWHFGAMVGLDRGKIRVHFDGWGPEWDEWIASDSRRLKVLDAEETTLRNSLLLPPTLLPSQAPTAVASESQHFQQLPMDSTPILQAVSAFKAIRPPTVALPMKPPRVLKPIAVKRKLAPSMDDVVPALMLVDPDLPRPFAKMVKKPKTSETLDLSGKSLPMPTSQIVPQSKKPKLDKSSLITTATSEGGAPARAAIMPAATTATRIGVAASNGMYIDLSSPKPSTTSAPNNPTLVLSFTNLKAAKPKATSTKDVPKPPKLIAIAPKGSTTGDSSTAAAEAATPGADKPVKLSLADARILLLGIEVGTKVQAQDKHGQWRPSTVVQVKARRVLVKFDECPNLADEWFIVDSNRLILPERPLMGPLHEDSQIRATPKAISTNDLKRRDSAWSPPIDIEGHSPIDCPATCSRSSSSSSSLSTAQSSQLSSPNTADLFSTSSDDLSEPGSTVSLPGDPADKEPAKDDEPPPPPPAPRPPHTLGNPILLDLPPYEVVAFEFEDQEKELLRIIHQVLDTGLIKNAVVEFSPEEYIPTVRVIKKKKKVVEGVGGEGAAEGEDGENEGDDDSEAEVEKKVSKRTNDKTRERFEALMEARLEKRNHRPSIFSPRKTPNAIRKKDPDVLQRIREEARRHMCNIPVLRYVRQVIYKESDRLEALNSSFERQKQKYARAISNRASSSNRMKIKRTSGPLSRRIFGLSNPNLTGITFNEAGYIESANIPKPVVVPSPEALKKLKKMQKKKERLMKMKAMENPNQDLLPDTTVDDTFQNLRSLTRDNKKRKRPLKEDHITFLRRTMVAGTRIRSRDRQMEWLTAVIRDVKNSRVLVHYEGFAEFFNEWIDINSERLKFDPTMEQYPVPLEGVLAPIVNTEAVVAPTPQVETTSSAAVPAETNEVLAESEVVVSNFEAISDNVQHEEGGKEVHCVQCQVKISQFRIYCMYCEVESKVEGSEQKPFNICLWCFSNAYPDYHDHPRSSFATKVIVGPRGVRPVKGGIITRFEKDLMDLEYKEPERPDTALVPDLHFQAMMGLESDQGFLYLDQQWKDKKVCAFCNDDGTSKDFFIGPQPFLLASTNREKGATIGCFDPKCGRSFHVPCTGKPMSHFEDGVIFWCPQHERALMQRDAYDDTFSCDRCSKVLGVNPWHSCSKCSEDYFHTFDLCRECFSKDDINHEHDKDDFNVTSLELMYKEQIEKETAAAQAIEAEEYAPVKKKVPNYKAKMRGLSRLVCSYCWSGTSSKWRKGYNGVLMCEDCFMAGPVNDIPMQPPMDIETLPDGVGSVPLSSVSVLAAQEEYSRGVGTYATSAEDYSHSPYLTRTAVSSVRFDHSSSQAVYLDSYGPAENQLFSLPIDTTYYDIPGRAPRLTLSIRNCSFAIPQDGSIKAEHRPTILQGDSRRLTGPLFESETFDHVLSHPPYKDCVAYSTHIDGDLSRFGNALEFQREMRSVVRETYRLLKMGRRCTLGIGDNREHCFYIPVSFQLIRQYINEGFELEELIVKRQRYCAMFGLGTYLCVQFDFLCFTHEFIATLRKVPKEEIDTMILEPDYAVLDDVGITSTVRAIPSCPVERKSVVMGSVWTFKPTEEYDFPTLCVSRMVERFGRNDANWEEYKLSFKVDNPDEAKSEQWAEHAVEILPPVEDDLVSYERDRLQQIQENNRMLLALGLITDLSETSDDLGHQTKISKDAPCYPPPAQTTLRLIAHIPCTTLKTHQITAYRTAIMHLAKQALDQLPVSGIFIVGAQDIRTETGKLFPLGMLVMEDVIRAVGEDCLRLKELIEAVPDGYQKDRRKITNWGEFKEEPRWPGDGIPTLHLPIVHACYLVFTKVKERVVPAQGTTTHA